MNRLPIRNWPFPYWWLFVSSLRLWRCLKRNPEPPLLRGYIKHREGLTVARFKDGRLTSPIPKTVRNREQAVKWLYELLSVLDSKASALMRLNGVMLAAAAFLLSTTDAGAPDVHLMDVSRVVILWIAALSAVSIGLCLLVVSVDWPFLGLVREISGELDFTDEVNNLQRVSQIRQGLYRSAWIVSFIASVLFVYAFITQIIPLVEKAWS